MTGSGTLTGTGSLLAFALRRDRIRIAIWTVALGVLTAYQVAALDGIYPTPTDRQNRAVLMTNPASVLLGGPGFGLDDYTLGAMVANEAMLTVLIAVAIMSILTVVRHTRAEEEAGRTELVRAAAVGRRAALTAAFGITAVANVLVAVAILLGLLLAGLPGLDSLAFVAAVGLTGMVFAAVASVAGQLTENARTASGAALGVLGVAALVRGLGDVAAPGGSALSWFSPIAWAQQARAFVDLRWWPLLASVTLVVAVAAVAYRLADRRDVAAGLLPARRGPAGASVLLAGPVGLAARLQRGSVLGWGVGLALLGSTVGSLTDAVVAEVDGNPQLAALITPSGTGSPTDAFFATMSTFLAAGAAAFAVGSVLRLRGEETAGRAELLLAAALGRGRWLGGGLLVTVAGSALLLAAGGLGLGVAAAAGLGDSGLAVELVGVLLVQLPAVLVLAGIAVALVGAAPRWSSAAWAVLAGVLFVGIFGELFGIPEWAQNLSPLRATPAVPVEETDPGVLVALTAVAAALFAAGLLGVRRRDLSVG